MPEVVEKTDGAGVKIYVGDKSYSINLEWAVQPGLEKVFSSTYEHIILKNVCEKY